MRWVFRLTPHEDPHVSCLTSREDPHASRFMPYEDPHASRVLMDSRLSPRTETLYKRDNATSYIYGVGGDTSA